MSKPALDLKAIFAQAFELDSPADRERYLARACRDDAGLRDEVESLLMAFAGAGAGNASESHVFSTMTPEERQAAEGPSAVIGAYTLLEQIGEGGMGIVYMAEQTHPLQRKVALKIIKPGMGSRQAIARFEAERQALALMDHPSIARVFDAGSTAAGHPYFVMELVKGIPITEYCDRARLTPRERLALLISVCQAIQHAHQKGIIHRDIKPSNVLVSLYDGKPVPKVIDFGVAKAIDQRLTERTLFTHHGAIVGTLEYMSPEQAENSDLDIDTRSDVYALGVLLYELMTGTTPLERQRTRQAPYSEVVRRIREEEPPKLSTRLSKTEGLAGVAAARGTEPARLARMTRGDLDWIAMKALEKDRERRYATANDLARDLERYLAGEPVEAAAPSAGYRLRKYARKHLAALVTVGAFLAVLVTATAFSAWQAVRAIREEANARQAEVEARAVERFFREKVLVAARAPGREGGLGRDVTLRAAIDAAEPTIAGDFVTQPKVEAAIRDTLGTTYMHQGELARAIRQHERALALRQATLGPEAPETLTSMRELAQCYRLADRAVEAVPLLEKVLAVHNAALGPEAPETQNAINNLAVVYQAAQRLPEALPLLEQVVDHAEKALGPNNLGTLLAMNNLAAAYKAANRLSDALRLFEKVYTSRKATLAPNDPDLLTSTNNLGATYQVVGRTAEAIVLFEEVLPRRQATLAPDHPDTLVTMSNLAQAYRETGQTARAVRLFEELLGYRRVKLEPGHADTLRTMNYLAAVYLETQRFQDAERLLRECWEFRRKGKADDWLRFYTMSQLGDCLAGQGKPAEAEPLLIEGCKGLIASAAKVPLARRKDASAAAARIVSFYDTWGQPEKAAAWRRELAQVGNGKDQRP